MLFLLLIIIVIAVIIIRRKKENAPEELETNPTIKGISNQVELLDDSIRLTKFANSFSAARTKIVNFSDITSVEIKEPGSIVAGYIQFSIAGQLSPNTRLSLTGGTIDAAKDENSVVFTGDKNLETAKLFQSTINRKKKSNQQQNGAAEISSASELLKFKELLDAGAISQEEFDKQKQRLLG